MLALLFFAMLLAIGCRPAVPVVLPKPVSLAPLVQAPADLGTNALLRVTQLAALGPRDAGTPGAEQAARWLVDELTKLGLTVTHDVFDDETPLGSLTFHNVWATLPGKSSAQVLLLSHFDTKTGIAPDFIGANDGGSSTGLLLALAEHLAGQPRELGVTFAFLDGEECLQSYAANDGLHGSRRLARQMQQKKVPIRAVILLDMIGDQDLCFTLPRNGTSSLKLLLLDATTAQNCRDRVKLLDSDMLDDHQPFLDLGFPAIDLIDFSYGSLPGENNFWHTPEDTLDKLSAETLRQVGAVTLEMIRRVEEL